MVESIVCPQCSQAIAVPAEARLPEPVEPRAVRKETSHPWYVLPRSARGRSRSHGTWERVPGLGSWWRLHEWPVGLQLLALLGLVVCGCLVFAWMRSGASTTSTMFRDPELEQRRAAEREQRRQQAAMREQKLLGGFLKAADQVAHDQPLAQWQAHTAGVTALAFAPDGRLLATGGDRRVQLWNLATGKITHTLGGPRQPVTQLAFSPDGRWLAGTSDEPTVQVWEVATGKLHRSLRSDAHVPVRRIAFSPDARTLALGSRPNAASFVPAVSLWDVRSGKRNPVRWHSAPLTGIGALSFLPDGDTLALGGSPEGGVLLFDLAAGRPREIAAAQLDEVSDLAVSPDGWTLAVAGPDDAERDGMVLQLVSLENGGAHRLGDSREHLVRGLTFSPDGRLLAAGCESQVRLWEVESRRELPPLTSSAADGQALAFSPGGTFLADSHGGDLDVWSTAQLEQEAPAER
jgi:WD40 repeat protein